LKKYYGDVHALNGVDLTVRKGEIFGLLGPNGAGKSTLIKSLVGSLKPTAGEIRLLGHMLPGQRKTVQQVIGYMPQSPALYEDISVRDNVRFFARAHQIDNLDKRIEEIIAFTALTDKRNKPIRTLSGGMKQRVSLACALVHNPEILFLDEPTAGVDPQLRESFWQYFRELASQGVTLFITTHLMDEAEDCHRLGIIQGGRILKVDTVENIFALGKQVVSIKEQDRWQEIPRIEESLASALYPYGLSTEVKDIQIQREGLQQIILKLCEGGESR
jgi:ABC-2 type transport system ATP-binding protein